MTSSPDAVPTQTVLAGQGLLRMVGASGAVCVDGTCSVEPLAQTPQESDHSND